MELLSAACALVREAGALFFDRDRSSQIREKAPTDYVTETDTTVQSFLQKKLAELDPGIGFLGEEQPERAKAAAAERRTARCLIIRFLSKDGNVLLYQMI